MCIRYSIACRLNGRVPFSRVIRVIDFLHAWYAIQQQDVFRAECRVDLLRKALLLVMMVKFTVKHCAVVNQADFAPPPFIMRIYAPLSQDSATYRPSNS